MSKIATSGKRRIMLVDVKGSHYLGSIAVGTAMERTKTRPTKTRPTKTSPTKTRPTKTRPTKTRIPVLTKQPKLMTKPTSRIPRYRYDRPSTTVGERDRVCTMLLCVNAFMHVRNAYVIERACGMYVCVCV